VGAAGKPVAGKTTIWTQTAVLCLYINWYNPQGRLKLPIEAF